MMKMDAQYASLDIFIDLESKVDRIKDQIENKLNNLLSKLNPQAIETSLREFQARIIPIEEKLRTKIDCDIFDDEIERIKQ